MSEDELGINPNTFMLLLTMIFMDEDKREELMRSINESEEESKSNTEGVNSSG